MSKELLTVTISQKRDIKTALEKMGLSISKFVWEPYHSNHQYGQPSVDRLVLKGTPYFFQFDRDDRQILWAEYCPGENAATQTERTIRGTLNLKRSKIGSTGF